MIVLSLSACATDPLDQIAAASAVQADASLSVNAARQAAIVPDLPEDCRRHERVEVQEGDRYDVVALRGIRAVGRGNARVDRCTNWYDALQESRAGGVQ